MHREFKRMLAGAEGKPHSVIVVFVDIRGFSAFSGRLESMETGQYIRKIYERILDDYFPFADYWKPTGDGLLVIIEYKENEEGTLERGLNLVVEASLLLVEKFKDLLAGDRMINFSPLPDKVGIGIARGIACQLVSGIGDNQKTLDYSGRLLNMAARLMDLARPEGIVIEGLAGMDYLTPERRARFTKDKVYLRGVSPSKAIDIYFTTGVTLIPATYRRRLDEPKWVKGGHQETFRSLKRTPKAIFSLSAKPTDPSEIVVYFQYPSAGPSGERAGNDWKRHRFKEFSYALVGNEPELRLRLTKFVKRLDAAGVKDSWPVVMTVKYPS